MVMFSATLDEVMTMQYNKFLDKKLPYIQTTLSEQVGCMACSLPIRQSHDYAIQQIPRQETALDSNYAL